MTIQRIITIISQLAALDEVEAMLSNYDIYVSTSMGDASAEQIASEMQVISVLVAVVVVTVLLLTSQTWAEVPVLLLTFISAALITKGTNFLMGTISFVSNSVTIVLQLALSIDYAVIFCNRYKEEHQTLDIREADIVALSKAIPEISSNPCNYFKPFGRIFINAGAFNAVWQGNG